jgi:hypothetical protein
VRALRAAELDRRAADAAGRGVHQQRLADAQVRPPVQPEPSGLVGDVEDGRAGVVQAGRRRQDVERVGDGELRQRAVRQRRRAHDPLAEARALHALADRDDLAAQLEPRRERQRRLLLVGAARQQRIGEVEAGRPDVDQDLSGTRRGHRHLGQRHDVDGLTGLRDLPRHHLGGDVDGLQLGRRLRAH